MGRHLRRGHQACRLAGSRGSPGAVLLPPSKNRRTSILHSRGRRRPRVQAAKAFYLVWLRKAASKLDVGSAGVLPRNATNRPCTVHLFDGLGDDEDGELASSSPTGAGSDAVTTEVQRYLLLPASQIDAFREENGMVNEFKMFFTLRAEFPIHYHVFRQTVVHISHEANAEDTFSLSGSLSNDNTHTCPGFLSRLTRMQRNKTRYMPSAAKILEKYKEKFRQPRLGEDVAEAPSEDDEYQEIEDDED
mmetsp:Transcript_37737/g.91788  ORF Transcript_37737/g.91788 Transcript_37737/m.91788 type:complete len:247 (-) Transcript_37737:163-903(-)